MKILPASTPSNDIDKRVWPGIWQSAGWPFATGIAAFVLGLTLLGAAALSFDKASRVRESNALLAPNTDAPPVAPSASGPEAFVSQLPDDSTYLNDVAFIFKEARDQAVTIGPIAYRMESSASIPVVVHTMELRLAEDYPKLKAFIAQLLEEMPHLSLDEIQIEQATSSGAANMGSKVQATLKLSLVYRRVVGPRPARGKNAQASR
jgi:hypothetical protein